MRKIGGEILGREPILYLAVAKTGLTMAMGFGLQLSGEQMALILVFIEALLTLIARKTTVPAMSITRVVTPTEQESHKERSETSETGIGRPEPRPPDSADRKRLF